MARNLDLTALRSFVAVAETGGRQQGVAAGVSGDVAVGVPAEPGRLVRPDETGQRHRTPCLERVHVDADTDPWRRH